VAPKPWP